MKVTSLSTMTSMSVEFQPHFGLGIIFNIKPSILVMPWFNDCLKTDLGDKDRINTFPSITGGPWANFHTKTVSDGALIYVGEKE